MTISRRIFRYAGIYGLIVLFPMLFLEARVGQDFPPPITHAEYFYGFLGLALVWQLVFLLIGSDPVRYRPIMPIAILEKLAWGGTVFGMLLLGRPIAVGSQVFAAIDLTLGVLFAIAWQRTPPR